MQANLFEALTGIAFEFSVSSVRCPTGRFGETASRIVCARKPPDCTRETISAKGIYAGLEET